MQLSPDPIITRPCLFRLNDEPEIVIQCVNAQGALCWHWLRPNSISTKMTLQDFTRHRQMAAQDGMPHFEIKRDLAPLPRPRCINVGIYRIDSDRFRVETDVLTLALGSEPGTLELGTERQYYDHDTLSVEASESFGLIQADDEGRQIVQAHAQDLIHSGQPHQMKSPLHLLGSSAMWLDACLARMTATPTRKSPVLNAADGLLAF
ncbi:hypothetical protein J7355_16640 [Endozoicomonas sp. G2_2]|uniref:hypothetical protein n=1 Tax=Endozoicomonas sp. G2_2 TaxID=2821092 RepID=UPI001ADA36A1|nr:hypothetical protein [Endozoicomonas sp. G2_2]MBO9471720.1 hypothetical protein [Endozoicomonas sp. G2_2]